MKCGVKKGFLQYVPHRLSHRFLKFIFLPSKADFDVYIMLRSPNKTVLKINVRTIPSCIIL